MWLQCYLRSHGTSYQRILWQNSLTNGRCCLRLITNLTSEIKRQKFYQGIWTISSRRFALIKFLSFYVGWIYIHQLDFISSQLKYSYDLILQALRRTAQGFDLFELQHLLVLKYVVHKYDYDNHVDNLFF